MPGPGCGCTPHGTAVCCALTSRKDERATATLLFTVGVLVYTLSVGVAFLNAYAFLALQGALAVYYAFDPISRRAAHGGQAGRDKS